MSFELVLGKEEIMLGKGYLAIYKSYANCLHPIPSIISPTSEPYQKEGESEWYILVLVKICEKNWAKKEFTLLDFNIPENSSDDSGNLNSLWLFTDKNWEYFQGLLVMEVEEAHVAYATLLEEHGIV